MGVVKVLITSLRIFTETLAWILFGIWNWNKTHKPLPPITNKLLLQSASSLAEKIRLRQVSSEEVVQLFIERIKSVNPSLNAVIETRFEEAINEAKLADDYIRKNPDDTEDLRKNKPFYGVPITVKENFKLKGFHLTTGLYSWKDNIADEDAEVVRLMKESGAVILGTTNVPELVMWWETANKIYGTTSNPYDLRRMVGGSSGGEAAIVSAAGSAIGIGSDIAGSIRMPAHFTGLFGHKCSPGLISTAGIEPNVCTLFNRYRTAGPLCKHACDLRATLKVIAVRKTYVNFDSTIDFKKLKIYYMEEDYSPLTTDVSIEVRGALLKTVEYFRSTYNTPCQKVNLAEMKYSLPILLSKFGEDPTAPTMADQLADGGAEVFLEWEILKMPFMKSRFTYPSLFLSLLRKYLSVDQASEKNKATINMFNALQTQFKEMLTENSIFLYPPSPTTALYHSETNFKPINCLYTAIFNVLGLPATACPVGLSPSGLPVGVQVIGGMYQDNLCISVAEELDKAFGGWVCPSEIK